MKVITLLSENGTFLITCFFGQQKLFGGLSASRLRVVLKLKPLLLVNHYCFVYRVNELKTTSYMTMLLCSVDSYNL